MSNRADKQDKATANSLGETKSVSAVSLEPYETFDISDDIGGGKIARLETHLMVHRKHTKKDLFRAHSFYNAMWLSDEPEDAFIEAFLLKARENRLEGINKGEYTDEEYIGGEYQTVKRKFNQWCFWDRANSKVVGKVNDLKPSDPKPSRGHSKSQSKEVNV